MKNMNILLVCIVACALASNSVFAMSEAVERTNGHDKIFGPVDRVDFIHYAKGKEPAKPASGQTSKCYKLMGVKWASLPVTYTINPTNTEGLSDEFVLNAVSGSAETWDQATSKEIFNDTYLINRSATYDGSKTDGQNSIVFGPYSNDGVIAITSVWYTRFGHNIVEFDMLFNDHFAWGNASSNSALMDLQNIATHELGHSVGLSDLYTQSCAEVTMYGYSGEGETAKRSLTKADIDGLRSIYGE